MQSTGKIVVSMSIDTTEIKRHFDCGKQGNHAPGVDKHPGTISYRRLVGL